MRTPRWLPGLSLALSVTALLAACANPPPQPAEPMQSSMHAEQRNVEGAIALDWQAPSDRTDGSTLSKRDIAGYRIYLGASPGDHTKVMEVTDPKQTHIIVSGLETDREYYVAITTVDSQGRESPKSREVREVAKPVEEVQTALEEHRSKERGHRS
jgi:fibronectin type 3 domain-containing protein